MNNKFNTLLKNKKQSKLNYKKLKILQIVIKIYFKYFLLKKE